MRIAMVITSYHPIVGGAERQVAQLAQAMQVAGHDVHIVTRHHPGLARAERVAGVPVHRVAAPGPKPLAAAAFLAGAALRLRRLAPDVIHAHSLFSPAIAATLGKALSGAPVLAKPMCGGEAAAIAAKRLGGRRIAHLGRTVDRFIAISTEIRDELLGLGIPGARIRFIPNGVDLDRFRPPSADEKAALRARLGLPGGVLAIFAGRMTAQKRVPLLLAAWARSGAAAGCGAAGAGAHLLLAGANRGPAGDADTIALDGPGLVPLGHVEDMPAYLRAADIFVLPSAREGLSNALLEACASGLAVIATRVGGTEDVIAPGRSGLLVPPDDADALAAALRDAVADGDLRARLGAAARARVVAQYDLAATAQGLIAEYHALLAARGAPRQAPALPGMEPGE